MKKIYAFLVSALMILCTACSNGGEASSITNSLAVNEAVPTDKADIPELAYTGPDPQYSALLSRTMMSLGLNGVERSWSNCAIQSDGALWNWSGNETQKVMDDVVAFSSNDYNLFAIKSDGSLWKFEREERFDGSLLHGRVDGDPIHIMDDVIAVSAERFLSMAIRSDGSLCAWGANNVGQLGDGTTEARQEPVKIMENVASVSTSDSNMMAIKSDGSLWAWGANSCGQLGDGTTDRRNRPVKIMDNAVTVLHVGGLYSMALCSDGTLWTWGVNPNVRLDAETMKRGEAPLSPVKVMDDVVSFSTASTIGGESFALAVCSDGSLWTWGWNNYGQLGTGNRQYSSEPVHILDNIVYARAFSDQFAIAIGEDEGVWVWGNGMDVLIPQQNNHSDDGINTPFRVDLDNLSHKDGQPDWMMVGSGDTWGIAGYPPTWDVQSAISVESVGRTRVPCGYIILDENGNRIMEIGLLLESYGIETLSDIMQNPSGNLSIESFVFNDGNTGLMIRGGEQITWVNGSAVMEFTAYQSLNEDSLFDIARTLCDRNRDNKIFLNAIDNELAMLGVSSTNASTVLKEGGKLDNSTSAEVTTNDITDQVLFCGTPIQDIIGMTKEQIIATFGEHATFTEDYIHYGDDTSEGMQFDFLYGNEVSGFSASPENFTFNGQSLDQNYDAMLTILGDNCIEQGGTTYAYSTAWAYGDCQISFRFPTYRNDTEDDKVIDVSVYPFG